MSNEDNISLIFNVRYSGDKDPEETNQHLEDMRNLWEKILSISYSYKHLPRMLHKPCHPIETGFSLFNK